MDFYRKVRAQQDQVDDGTLKVSVFTEDGTRPVENALVRISYTGESGQTVDEVRTDSSGQTPVLDKDLVVAALARRGFAYPIIKEAIRRVEEDG